MRTSRAMSEENSTLVQWLTVSSSTGSLRTKAAILSLVDRKNKRREETRVEIEHPAWALKPFISHRAQPFRARPPRTRHSGAECRQIIERQRAP